jgi:hypothetical protein
MLCREGSYSSGYTEFYFSSAYPGRTRNYVQGRQPRKVTSSYYTAGIYNISTMFDDNETGVTYKNGLIVASEGIDTSQNKQWGPGNIGAYSSDGINYNDYLYDGNIGEIVIYNSALSTGPRQNVQEYLEDKWNITTFSLIRSASFWIDAADTNTVWRHATCSGPKANPGSHTVGCIEDKSGNNHHATQTNSSYRPQYSSEAAGQNNNPTLNFDGNNDRLAYPDIGTFDNTTVFAVHKENSYPNTGQMIVGPTGWTAKNTWLYYELHPGARMRFWVEGRDPYTLTHVNHGSAGTYMVTSAYDNNVNTAIYKNGSITVSSPITTTNVKEWGPGHIGGWDNTSYWEQFHNGNIGEIIIFDSALSKTDREYIENYLGSKWDITISH